jgi:sulfatase modifying factor 1
MKRIAWTIALAALLLSSCGGLWGEFQNVNDPIAGMPMVFVSGGDFPMGSMNSADSQPVHTVTLSSFWIGAVEVTKGFYYEVSPQSEYYGTGESAYSPATFTWDTAIYFCNNLSAKEGRDAVYIITGPIPDGVTADFSKNGYRLPTEAEWEFAARGGILASGFAFAGSDTYSEVAWTADNSQQRIGNIWGWFTRTIATKAANELGIFDMSGNVAEWCQDRYDASYYSISPTQDPMGPASGTTMVVRGGATNMGNEMATVYARQAAGWNENSGYYYQTSPIIGLRVVRRGL